MNTKKRPFTPFAPRRIFLITWLPPSLPTDPSKASGRASGWDTTKPQLENVRCKPLMQPLCTPLPLCTSSLSALLLSLWLLFWLCFHLPPHSAHLCSLLSVGAKACKVLTPNNLFQGRNRCCRWPAQCGWLLARWKTGISAIVPLGVHRRAATNRVKYWNVPIPAPAFNGPSAEFRCSYKEVEKDCTVWGLGILFFGGGGANRQKRGHNQCCANLFKRTRQQADMTDFRRKWHKQSSLG